MDFIFFFKSQAGQTCCVVLAHWIAMMAKQTAQHHLYAIIQRTILARKSIID